MMKMMKMMIIALLSMLVLVEGQQTRVLNRSLPANCTQDGRYILCESQPTIGTYPIGPYKVHNGNGSYVDGVVFFQSLETQWPSREDSRLKRIASGTKLYEKVHADSYVQKDVEDAFHEAYDQVLKDIEGTRQERLQLEDYLKRMEYLVHGHGGYSPPSDRASYSLRGSAPSAVSSETEKTTSEYASAHEVVLFFLIALIMSYLFYKEKDAILAKMRSAREHLGCCCRA